MAIVILTIRKYNNHKNNDYGIGKDKPNWLCSSHAEFTRAMDSPSQNSICVVQESKLQ